MRIEAGKRYFMRGGSLTTPMRPNDNADIRYAFAAPDFPLPKGTACWWTETGAYFADDPGEHPSDLIAEYVELENIAYPDETFDDNRLPPTARNAYTVAAEDALTEVRRAKELFPAPANSMHEQFAVLWEEFDELKAHVWMNQKRRDLTAARKEAIQVAAMAIRFAAECCDETVGRR